jgi:hypothetical protein
MRPLGAGVPTRRIADFDVAFRGASEDVASQRLAMPLRVAVDGDSGRLEEFIERHARRERAQLRLV